VHKAILSQQHLTNSTVFKPHDRRPLGLCPAARFRDRMREIGPAIDPHSDKI
jgi:hypothetical protein